MTNYLISDLAKKTGLSADTIRFYEKKGLIRAEFRADNQYRYFSESALKRLKMIKKCRSLDMSLKEIEQLIELELSPHADCSVVNNMIDHHINTISQKLEELKAFKQQLIELRERCNQPTTIDHCQILKNLEDHSAS